MYLYNFSVLGHGCLCTTALNFDFSYKAIVEKIITHDGTRLFFSLFGV